MSLIKQRRSDKIPKPPTTQKRTVGRTKLRRTAAMLREAKWEMKEIVKKQKCILPRQQDVYIDRLYYIPVRQKAIRKQADQGLMMSRMEVKIPIVEEKKKRKESSYFLACC